MKAIDVTRLRERRVFQGRKFEARPALFPGYCFVLIELQWHAARWAPGTLGLVMDEPARVPERMIAEIHRREVNGLIEVSNHRFDLATDCAPAMHRSLSRDNLDENGCGNQSLKRRPVAKV